MKCRKHEGKKLNGILCDADWNNLSRRTYVEHHGEVPEGHIVLRSCKNKMCIEPSHLFSAPRKMHNYSEVVWNDRKGESNNNAVLQEADIRDIRLQRAKGRLLKSIAEEFGISKNCVWSICKRNTWDHVK